MNLYTHQPSALKPVQTFLFLFLFFLSYTPTNAQCTGSFTIFTEDFEDHGNTANGGAGRYTSANDFHDGGTDDDYWGRVQAGTELFFLTGTSSGIIANTNVAYSGQNGNFFYCGEDLDDTGGSIGSPDGLDEKSILFSGININGATSMCFSGLFARGNTDGCSLSEYDGTDYINIYYNIDGAGEVLGMCFNPDLECNIPADVTNEPLHHDADCDGDGGEGAVLTAVLSEFTFNIIGTGSTMDIRLEAHMDSGDEEIAFDYFRVRSDTEVLPVTLTSFKAAKENKAVRLNWETASEVNNDYFAIEHSTNGQDYQEVGRVDGNGNTVDRISYSFVHDNPSQGTNFYRLHQYDFDGRSEYSDVRTVEFDRFTRAITVSPNPFNEKLSLDLNFAFNQETEVNVYSLIGELVFATTIEADALNQNLDLSELATGAYILKVGNAENAMTQRIVKY